MTRAELVEVLAVERHAPTPRPPRTGACDPPEPITEAQAERNRQVLADSIGGDLHVIEFNERSVG